MTGAAAAAAAGIARRAIGGFAKPSGKSFQAGRFVAVVYVAAGGPAGDCAEARGGGGTAAAPNAVDGAAAAGGSEGW